MFVHSFSGASGLGLPHKANQIWGYFQGDFKTLFRADQSTSPECKMVQTHSL